MTCHHHQKKKKTINLYRNSFAAYCRRWRWRGKAVRQEREWVVDGGAGGDVSELVGFSAKFCSLQIYCSNAIQHSSDPLLYPSPCPSSLCCTVAVKPAPLGMHKTDDYVTAGEEILRILNPGPVEQLLRPKTRMMMMTVVVV